MIGVPVCVLVCIGLLVASIAEPIKAGVLEVGESGLTVRCAWLYRICPDWISTRYERGESAGPKIRPVVRFSSFVNHTSESLGISGGGLAPWWVSKSLFCFCLKRSFASRKSLRYVHSGVRVSIASRRLDWMCLRMNNSAADSRHHGRGVDLSDSNDRHGSFKPFNSLFTVWTALSACPLLWGKCGLLLVCLKPYSLAKSVNSCDEYCDPLLLRTSSGMPYYAKMDLRAVIMLVEVVDVRWPLASGKSSWQQWHSGSVGCEEVWSNFLLGIVWMGREH